MEFIEIAVVVVSVALVMVGLLIVFHSITQQKVKVIEGQLFSQYAALLFTEMNVHERLDNPIKTINTIIPMIDVDKYGNLDNLSRQVKTISNGVKYMKRTLNMLDGRENLKKYQFNLNKTISEELLLKEKYGDDVRLIDNGKHCSIVGTKMEILAAVSVVIDNALIYGKPPVQIEIIHHDYRKVRIIVTDQGTDKFDQQTIDIIKQIDEMTDKTGVRELIAQTSKSGHGNGVGLIVAHLVAKAYNGRLFLINRDSVFEEKEYESTTVIVELARS